MTRLKELKPKLFVRKSYIHSEQKYTFFCLNFYINVIHYRDVFALFSLLVSTFYIYLIFRKLLFTYMYHNHDGQTFI